MKYLALVALVLAGCSQEPRQYGAPVPLVMAPPLTFDTPVFRAPGATITCYQFGNTMNCY
jgi:hypothetical protein